MKIELITFENKTNLRLIKDVLLYPLKINKDASGILVETLRRDWPQVYGKDREFFMQYYSVTPSGVARDENVWHYHPTVQEDRFLVIKGDIVVAVADNREDSETKGLLNLFFMQSQTNPFILLIPKRTLHGFMVVSKDDAILLNFPTALYNPEEEGRIPYNEAGMKLGHLPFSWNIVRNEFPLTSNR